MRAGARDVAADGAGAEAAVRGARAAQGGAGGQETVDAEGRVNEVSVE